MVSISIQSFACLLLIAFGVVAVFASQQQYAGKFSRRVFSSMSARAIEAVESYSISSVGTSEWHRMHGKEGVWSRHWSHHGLRSVVSTEHSYDKTVRFPFRTEGNLIQPYPDKITLSFTIFGESHEYELHIARQLISPSAIVQTNPYTNENHPAHLTAYWHFFNDGRGSFITATVRPDGRFSAVVNREGQTLQIDPTVEHRHEMEAEDLDAMDHHAPHGLVGFYHHDLKDLEKTHLCGSVGAGRPHREKMAKRESIDNGDHEQNKANDNGVVLGPRRSLLAIEVFDDSCFPNKATQPKKLAVGIATDAGLCRVYGCAVDNVKAALQQIYSTINAIYYQQMSVFLEINEFQIRLNTATADSGEETWNKDTGGKTRKEGNEKSTCGASYDIDPDLQAFSLWRMQKQKNKYGEWHKITDCFPPPGTVGLAWLGVLCFNGQTGGGQSSSSTGVSSQSSTSWLTIAHEIGHNFNADHTFQNGQGATGGIMDYGDGRNPPKTGDFQFNKFYSQSQMCGEIASTLNTKGMTPYCWANFAAICGNGIVEPGESCDEPNNPCCDKVTCQMVTGAQCSSGPCCDTDPNSASKCMFKPSTTLCSNGNAHCANGVCTSTVCNQYSNLDWGQGKCTFASGSGGCKIQCQDTGSGRCADFSQLNTLLKDGTVCSSSPYSVCRSGKCTATTAPPTVGPGGGGGETTTAAPGTTTTTTTATLAPTTYTWQVGTWGTCQNGQQTRTVLCRATTNGVTMTVSDSSCTSSSKPATSQSCAIYQWMPNDSTSNWGACSVDCGSGGVQTRTVACYDVSYTTPAAASSQSLCTATKPITQRSCPSTSACPATWQYGGWTTCSASCGPGTQTRTGTCFMTQNGRLISTTDQYCIDNNAGAKGATSQGCEIVACATYNWVYGQWSSCSKSCGGGSQTRTATCTQKNGDGSTNTVADSQCTATKQPTSQQCNTEVCPVYSWSTGSFSACSAKCGGGTESRSVECFNTAVNPPEKVFDYYCTTAKPVTEQSCNTNICPVYQWRYTVWGACSKTCGGGTQTRSAICHDVANYPLSGCDANSATCTGDSSDATLCTASKDSTSQSCNEQPCATYDWKVGDWASCDKACGGGSQTRSVQCVSNSGTVVADSTCTGSKPLSTQQCNTAVCTTYNWVTSSWSACSVACGIGGGSRTRTVQCQASTGGTVADSQCTATKPATSEVCNNFKCNSFWYTSAWSGCSATCGGGVASRSVDCRLVSDDKTPNSGQGTCTDAQPSTTAPCNTDPCPTWISQPWSPCSVRCGTGQQNRTNVCTRYDKTIAPTSECPANAQPITIQICTVDPCPHWHRDPWGECSVTCGGGVRTRTITCRMPHDAVWGGRAVSDKTLCPADMSSGSDQGESTDLIEGLPVTSETCNVQACDTYYWKATWGACSESCGGGVSLASYSCVNSRTGEVQSGANERLCTVPKPSEAKDLSRACNTFDCAYYQWIALGWKQCLGSGGETLVCGKGTQTRSVVCGNTKVAVDPSRYNVTYDVVADSYCASLQKPSTNQECSLPSDACYGSVTGETNGGCTQQGTCLCRPGYGGVDCKINPSITNVKSNAATYTKGVPLGESIIISWSSGGSIDSVNILLMKNTWETGLYIEKDVQNKGSYVWSVGSGLLDASKLESGDGYSIQVYFSSSVNANSASFTLAPPCAYVSCGTHGTCINGACTCSPGFLGSTCQESVCAAKCIEKNTDKCDASTNFDCSCKQGWTGSSCANPASSGCPSCTNGDYPPNSVVDSTLGCPSCQCPPKSFFIGKLCDECFLQCGGGGKPSSNCTVCTDCRAGFFGQTCSCRFYLFKLQLKFSAESKLYDLSWMNTESSASRIKQTIVVDILAALGLPSSRIQLTVDSIEKVTNAAGVIIVTLRLNRPCANVQVQRNDFKLFAEAFDRRRSYNHKSVTNVAMAVVDDDDSLAGLWRAVRSVFQYADSDVYKSGIVTRNIDLSYGIPVSDPSAVDSPAPSGIAPNSVKDRFDDARNNNGFIRDQPNQESAASSSSSTNWVLIGAAAGGGLAFILIVAIVYFVLRNRSSFNSNSKTLSNSAITSNYTAKPPTPIVPGHTSNPSIQLMANPAIIGAKALPPFWSEHQTDAGQTYFYNSRTGVTQWERPTA